MNYKISNEASNDLKEIWNYTTQNWSKQQADYYINLILDEIEHLAFAPYPGQDYSFLRIGYFRSKVKSHFIFYKINSDDESVEVIRILHQQMDIKSHLEES
jgi:toxin ParE1/3/4